ncbi:MAG: GNAT family N-acetyltransferase [Verrucomicrobiia bacterium]
MPKASYTKFIWDLSQFVMPENGAKPLGDIREATRGEAELVWAVIERAVMADPAWSVGLKSRLRELRPVVFEGMDSGKATFLVIHSGERFIGASGLVADSGAARQLVTGVHIVNEFRCRGQGTHLLAGSLAWLKQKGLAEAAAITKVGIAAEKYLYGKFGGKSMPIESVPPLPRFSRK